MKGSDFYILAKKGARLVLASPVMDGLNDR